MSAKQKPEPRKRAPTPDINKILALPANCAVSPYGAAMGRRDIPPSGPCRLYLQRVKPCDGGDYDAGGAYWGCLGIRPLWCAFGHCEGHKVMMFVRASDREAAKEAVWLSVGVSWYR